MAIRTTLPAARSLMDTTKVRDDSHTWVSRHTRRSYWRCWSALDGSHQEWVSVSGLTWLSRGNKRIFKMFIVSRWFPVAYASHKYILYILHEYICEFKNWLCLTCLSCGKVLRERMSKWVCVKVSGNESKVKVRELWGRWPLSFVQTVLYYALWEVHFRGSKTPKRRAKKMT